MRWAKKKEKKKKNRQRYLFPAARIIMGKQHNILRVCHVSLRAEAAVLWVIIPLPCWCNLRLACEVSFATHRLWPHYLLHYFLFQFYYLPSDNVQGVTHSKLKSWHKSSSTTNFIEPILLPCVYPLAPRPFTEIFYLLCIYTPRFLLIVL